MDYKILLSGLQVFNAFDGDPVIEFDAPGLDVRKDAVLQFESRFIDDHLLVVINGQTIDDPIPNSQQEWGTSIRIVPAGAIAREGNTFTIGGLDTNASLRNIVLFYKTGGAAIADPGIDIDFPTDVVSLD